MTTELSQEDVVAAEKPVLSFNEMMTAAVASLIASGKVQKRIEEAVEKSVLSVLDQMICPHGYFGEMIKKGVRENSTACVVNFPDYGGFIARRVEAALAAKAEQDLSDTVNAMVRNITESCPRDITLTKLVSQYKKWIRKRSRETNKDGTCYCDVKVTDHGIDGFLYIALHPKRVSSEFEAHVRIGLHKRDDKWVVFSLNIDRVDQKDRIFIGPLYDFERTIFSLYQCEGEIKIDCNASELNLRVRGGSDPCEDDESDDEDYDD